MTIQNIDDGSRAGSISGWAAYDVMWAFGAGAIALTLTPLIFIYALLVA